MAKKLTKKKAREILHDKEVHGHPLTDQQRKFFGAIAGGAKPYKAQNGIEGTMGGLTDKGFNFNPAWGGAWREGGELPGAQRGITQASSRTIVPTRLNPSIPTAADSARVYNAAVAMMNYYKNDRRHHKPEINTYHPIVDRATITDVGQRNLETYRSMYKNLVGNTSDFWYNTYYKPDYGISKQELLRLIGRAIDESKSAPPGVTYYKDSYPSKIDINAPSAVIDSRIAPQGFINFSSSVPRNARQIPLGPEPAGIVTGLYYYDPLAVKPYSMRTEKEKQEWDKKYGTPKPTKPPVKKEIPKSTPKPIELPKYQPPTKTQPEPVKSVPKSPDPVSSMMSKGKKVELLVDDFGNYEWFNTDDDAGDLKPIRRATREEIERSKSQKRNGGWLDKYQDGGELQPPMAGANQTIPMYAMGGGIPGAVGFTYARTSGAAPSEGPYAKKTLPSAQNGQEMKFFQEGLDWKPKTISRNGGWLDKYSDEVPEAQRGITQRYSVGPMIGDLATESGYINQMKQAKIQAEKPAVLAKIKTKQEEEIERKAAARKPKQEFIGPAKELKPWEQEEANKRRYDLNKQYASQYPDDVVFNFKTGDIGRKGQESGSDWGTVNIPELVQTAEFATPSGVNYGAGQIGAETFVNLNPITGPGMSASRLTQFGLGKNPYGFGSDNPWYMNTLGGLGLIGDVFSVGIVPGMRVSQNAPLSAKLSNKITQQVKPPMLLAVQKVAAPLNVATEATPVTTPTKAWQVQEMPGLHLKSTMSDGAVTKIVEPKTGLVNVEQALGIISKESGGKEKVEMIRKALGSNTPKKMNYDDFRKTIQNQIIPLKREFRTTGQGVKSDYGLENIGFKKVRFNDDVVGGVEIIPETVPLENQTMVLSNADEFGLGSGVHTGADETLGHIHFIRDVESPNVGTVTQMQADALQGTHSIMPKKGASSTKFFESPEYIERFNKQLKTNKEIYDNLKYKYDNNILDEQGFPIHESQVAQAKQNYESSRLAFNHAKNLPQKQLLEKGQQERLLQEFVDYAGKRGDLDKVRLPTSETAAKIQGYKKVTTNADELRQLRTNVREASEKYGTESVQFAEADAAYENAIKNNKGVYSSEHQTILKRYDKQPELVKKLFGQDAKIVTDSKGNTWYEFDIPKSFKSGKGEIRAFEDGGEVVQDNEGYWNSMNWGKPVQINSNQITMEGVNEPLLGISDTGDMQMMEPGKNYTFQGKTVTEYPREYFQQMGVARGGKSVNKADEYPLEKLDNLFNFTNYNKPKAKSGKWLDKYN